MVVCGGSAITHEDQVFIDMGVQVRHAWA